LIIGEQERGFPHLIIEGAFPGYPRGYAYDLDQSSHSEKENCLR